ncbi:MAG TPA: response regulator [Flavisolibacter sp.]|nr:response regulator [Flavisolibacter sp.]
MISNIIFCEDDEDDRFLFNDVTKDFNPKLMVEFVSHGLRLMELLKHYVPDLLFLDLEMPFKNGLKCLVEIRRNPTLENLPVIMFSSTTRQSNIQTAYDMGAHLFLVKSPTFSEYASSIRAVLQLDWSKPKAIREQYCVNGRYTAFS